MKLQGKWALVTGSSRGIGRYVASALADHGCSVIVHGREMSHLAGTVDQLRSIGVDVHAVAGELSSPEGVASVIEAVKSGPGHVDILYNNAAIQGQWREIFEIAQVEWQEIMQVNLYAVVQLCNAFGPEMKRRGYGRIVNVSSGIGGIPQLVPYSVSKAAIDKYTRDLAAEFRGSNVLVNALDPGWLRTDLGGPHAPGAPESVLPGALVPVLLDDNGPSGEKFEAQAYAK
jgi:NAD(P)-dependent dehydrogenase (short-subunit alcohol dehydrogenase family)